MPPTDPVAPEYYFALPRLLARLRGRSVARSEKNWTEANIVGGAVILISFLAVDRFIWSDCSGAAQLALVIPTLVFACIFWLIVIYLDAQIIKALRRLGYLRGVPNTRVQSVFVIAITTALACSLLDEGRLLGAIGAAWITAAAANFIATALLRFSHPGYAR